MMYYFAKYLLVHEIRVKLILLPKHKLWIWTSWTLHGSVSTLQWWLTQWHKGTSICCMWLPFGGNLKNMWGSLRWERLLLVLTRLLVLCPTTEKTEVIADKDLLCGWVKLYVKNNCSVQLLFALSTQTSLFNVFYSLSSLWWNKLLLLQLMLTYILLAYILCVMSSLRGMCCNWTENCPQTSLHWLLSKKSFTFYGSRVMGKET